MARSAKALMKRVIPQTLTFSVLVLAYLCTHSFSFTICVLVLIKYIIISNAQAKADANTQEMNGTEPEGPKAKQD